MYGKTRDCFDSEVTIWGLTHRLCIQPYCQLSILLELFFFAMQLIIWFGDKLKMRM